MARPNNTPSQNAGVLGFFNRARHDFASYRARRAQIRQTSDELHSMSDRELNEIGISRGDIPQIARSLTS